ncbi:MAG: YggS family pyridoxal phosphate-dependent enzyme [Bdellovibrio bacteriovorus]
MNDPSIATRLALVQARIAAATRAAGRPDGSVGLVAVSKLQGAEAIRAAFAAGQRAFGENYVQEALEKQAQLPDLPIEWHFIGRIQTNKTRAIAEHFSWVHGLADPHHARRLSDQRPPGMGPLWACAQVNLGGEATKGGVRPDDLPALIATCAGLPGLRLVGLMTLPEPVAEPELQRRPFRALRELRDRLATRALPLDCLSMGMSDDLEAAIAEGATLVRVGTAVFGPRPYTMGPRVPGPSA